MKPRATPYDKEIPVLAWKCWGEKNGKYHVVFSYSWPEAVEKWYATVPTDEDWTDIPF